MARYRVIRSFEEDAWEEWRPLLPSLTVDELSPQDTGLLDQHGNKIVRMPNGIGFQAEVE